MRKDTGLKASLSLFSFSACSNWEWTTMTSKYQRWRNVDILFPFLLNTNSRLMFIMQRARANIHSAYMSKFKHWRRWEHPVSITISYPFISSGGLLHSHRPWRTVQNSITANEWGHSAVHISFKSSTLIMTGLAPSNQQTSTWNGPASAELRQVLA